MTDNGTADLISRAATLERMKSMAGCATCDNYNYVRCRACSWDDAMNIVEEMSEIEAVPVVRCRDCRYWGTPFDINDTGFMVAHCEHFDESHAFSEQFYCASGERRDGE